MGARPRSQLGTPLYPVPEVGADISTTNYGRSVDAKRFAIPNFMDCCGQAHTPSKGGGQNVHIRRCGRVIRSGPSLSQQPERALIPISSLAPQPQRSGSFFYNELRPLGRRKAAAPTNFIDCCGEATWPLGLSFPLVERSPNELSS